jgi:hypothetical protein
LNGGGTRKVNPGELAAFGDTVSEWRKKLAALTPKQRKSAEKVIFKNVFTDETCITGNSAVDDVLRFYRIRKYDEIPEIIAED